MSLFSSLFKGFEFIPEVVNFNTSNPISLKLRGSKMTLSQFKRVIEPIIKVKSISSSIPCLILSHFTLVGLIFQKSTIGVFC